MTFDPSGILVNLVSGAIGFGLSRTWGFFNTVRRQRGQAALLKGIESPFFFVFPLRERPDQTVLPRTSTEDFMAINNIISALMLVGQSPKIRVRDPDRLTEAEKKQNNLILICSSKRNSVTDEALSLLRNRLGDRAPSFEIDPKTSRLSIRFNKATYHSDSFDQQGPDYDDIALIMKVRSPWSEEHKVLILAGIRGFGTWGAAEALKKWWRQLYDRKGSLPNRKIYKTGDFAAILHVQYRDCDIKFAHPLNVVDLDEQLDERVVSTHTRKLETKGAGAGH